MINLQVRRIVKPLDVISTVIVLALCTIFSRDCRNFHGWKFNVAGKANIALQQENINSSASEPKIGTCVVDAIAEIQSVGHPAEFTL